MNCSAWTDKLFPEPTAATFKYPIVYNISCKLSEGYTYYFQVSPKNLLGLSKSPATIVRQFGAIFGTPGFDYLSSSGASVAIWNGKLQVWQNGNISETITVRIMNIPVINDWHSMSIVFDAGNWTKSVNFTVVSSFIQSGTLIQFPPPILPQNSFLACQAVTVSVVISFPVAFESFGSLFYPVSYMCYPKPILNYVVPAQGAIAGGTLLVISVFDPSGPLTRQGANLPNFQDVLRKQRQLKIYFEVVSSNYSVSATILSISASSDGSQSIIISSRTPAVDAAEVANMIFVIDDIPLVMGTSFAASTFEFVGSKILSVTPGSGALNPGSGGLVLTVKVSNLMQSEANISISVGGLPCLVYLPLPKPSSSAVGTVTSIKCRAPELPLSKTGPVAIQIVLPRLENNVLVSFWQYLLPPAPYVDLATVVITDQTARTGQPFWIAYNEVARISFVIQNVGAFFGRTVYNISLDKAVIGNINMLPTGSDLQVTVNVVETGPVRVDAPLYISISLETEVNVFSQMIVRGFDVEIQDITQPQVVALAPSQIPAIDSSIFVVGIVSAAEIMSVPISSQVCKLVWPSGNLSVRLYGVVSLTVWLQGDGQISTYFPTSQVKSLMAGASQDILSQFQNIPAQTSVSAGQRGSTDNAIVVGEISTVVLANDHSDSINAELQLFFSTKLLRGQISLAKDPVGAPTVTAQTENNDLRSGLSGNIQLFVNLQNFAVVRTVAELLVKFDSDSVKVQRLLQSNSNSTNFVVIVPPSSTVKTSRVTIAAVRTSSNIASFFLQYYDDRLPVISSFSPYQVYSSPGGTQLRVILTNFPQVQLTYIMMKIQLGSTIFPLITASSCVYSSGSATVAFLTPSTTLSGTAVFTISITSSGLTTAPTQFQMIAVPTTPPLVVKVTPTTGLSNGGYLITIVMSNIKKLNQGDTVVANVSLAVEWQQVYCTVSASSIIQTTLTFPAPSFGYGGVSSVQVWQQGRQGLSAFFTFLYIDANIPVLNYVYPSNGYSGENVAVEVSVSRFGVPSNIELYSLIFDSAQNGSVVGVSESADGSTILSLTLFSSVPTSVPVNFTAEHCVTINSCLRTLFVFAFLDPNEPRISFFFPTSVTTDGRMPVSVEMSNLPNAVSASEMTIQIIDGVDSFVLNASISSLNIISQHNSGNDVTFQFIAPGANGGTPAQGLIVTLHWMDTTSMKRGQAIFPSSFAYTTPPAISIASVIPTKAFIEIASLMVIEINNFPGVSQLSDIVVMFSNPETNVEADIVSFSRVNPSNYQYAVQDIVVTITTPFGGSVSEGFWRLSAHHATYYQRVAILDGFLFGSSTSPQTQGMTSETGQTGISSLSVRRSMKTLVTVVVSSVSSLPNSVIVGTYPVSLVHSDFESSSNTATAVFHAPSSTCAVPCNPEYGFITFSSRCSKCADASCCQSATCSISCGDSCRLACFSFKYYDDLQPSIAFQSDLQGPSTGGTTINMKINNFPPVQSSAELVALFLNSNIQGSVYVSSSSSSVTDLTIVTPSVDTGGANSLAYSQNTLYALAQPDMRVTFPFTFNLVVPSVQSVSPSIGVRSDNVLVTVVIANFPYPTTVGLMFGPTLLPKSAVSVLPVSNALTTVISFSTLSSPTSGQVTCKLFPKSCPVSCGQAVTFFFQQIEPFQILPPVPSRKAAESSSLITLRLTNIPDQGQLFITFANSLGIIVFSPPLASRIQVPNATEVIFATPSQIGVYACKVIIDLLGSNSTLSFSYHIYNAELARIISVQPSQAPIQMQIYGKTVSPQTLISVLISNFPQGLSSDAVVVSFGADNYGDVESIDDISTCEAENCNKTLLVILAPSIVVPGIISCQILSSAINVSDSLYFNLTYFSPCDFATYCSSTSLIADSLQIVQKPPSSSDCDIQYCVDLATLGDPELISYFPSEGQATGGTVVVLTVRNLPILSAQTVLISAGAGAEQVLFSPTSIIQSAVANLQSSSCTISFRTVSNPTSTPSIVSNVQYTITSSIGPISKQLLFLFQYTPVIVGNAVVVNVYPTSVQTADETTLTWQLTNFPMVTDASAFHIIAQLACDVSDIFRANAIISSSYTSTIASIVFNVNFTGVCPVKIFWEDFGEEQSGIYNISFYPPPEPTVLSWFPQRGSRGKSMNLNMLYWDPSLTLADFSIIIVDEEFKVNISSLSFTGPSSCIQASCSEFALTFIIPNLPDNGNARTFVFAIMAEGKIIHLNLPVDSQIIPFVSTVLPTSVVVTEINQTNITVHISNSHTFCLSNSKLSVIFGTRHGTVLMAAVQGAMCVVTIRLPSISDDSEISCTISNAIDSVEFCSSNSAVRLQLIPAPIYIEPVDCVCSGGDSIKFTLVGYSFGILNSSNIEVIFGGISGKSIDIISQGTNEDNFTFLAFNTTTPVFNIESASIEGYVLIRGSKIPFPFFFECFVSPTATVLPSQAALDGTTSSGSKSTILNIKSFPKLSTTQDVEVAFDGLVCNGLSCAVLNFQNVAGGVILNVQVPAWAVQATINLSVSFVGAAPLPAGGALTTYFVRTPRVASVLFAFVVPAPVVISALFCLKCNYGDSCIVNAKCAAGQNPRTNSVALSGSGVLTVVIHNVPQIYYNFSSGAILTPATIGLQVGNIFATILRIGFADLSMLSFEAKLMGAAPTAGISAAKISVQPDTSSPVVAAALFQVNVFDDNFELGCMHPYTCQGSSEMGSSFMVSLSNFPLDPADVSELIAVQFCNILAADVQLVNSTDESTVLLISPPNCSGCQYSDGAAVCSLRVVYSADSTEIAATTFTFWEPPSILTASFDPYGTQIQVTFDQDTDRAGMSVWNVVCNGLIQNANELFGYDSRCVWTANNQLNIFLGGQASVVPGSSLNILPAGTLRSINSISLASAAFAVITAPVLVPPTVIVKSIDVIDVCSALEIRTTVASPRPLISYMWNCLNDPVFDSFLSSVAGPVLRLASGTPQMQTVDKTYSIAFSATDFLGSTTAQVVINVLKQSAPAPQVQFNPPSLSINRNQPVLVRGQAVFTSCPVDQGDLRFSWRLVSGPSDFPVVALSAPIPQIYVPSDSLTAGATYILGLKVSIAENSAQVSEGLFVLQVGYQLLVAVIDGGSSMLVSASSKLELSAENSYDPDLNFESDSPASNSSLSFSWQCTTNDGYVTTPCRNLYGVPLNLAPSARIEIFGGSLTPLGAPYIFTVTVTKGARAPATASMPVFVVGDERPTVSIGSQCTRADFDQRACCFEPSGEIIANINSHLIFSGKSELPNTTFLWTLSPTLGALDAATIPLGNMSDQFILQGTLGVFVPGNTYTVQLFGFGIDSDLPSQAEQSLVINSPPVGGKFSVCLVTTDSMGSEDCITTGATVIDTFLLSSSAWTDPEGDSLLEYRFGYFIAHNSSGNYSNITAAIWFDWAGDSAKEMSFPSGFVIAVAQVKDDCGAQTDVLEAPVNVTSGGGGLGRRLLASSDFWAEAQAKVRSALQTFRPDNVNQLASSIAAEISKLSAEATSAVALKETLLDFLRTAVGQV